MSQELQRLGIMSTGELVLLVTAQHFYPLAIMKPFLQATD